MADQQVPQQQNDKEVVKTIHYSVAIYAAGDHPGLKQRLMDEVTQAGGNVYYEDDHELCAFLYSLPHGTENPLDRHLADKPSHIAMMEQPQNSGVSKAKTNRKKK